jgi:hypothetical protein
MLYSEIIAVCSQIHTNHINSLCGQNVPRSKHTNQLTLYSEINSDPHKTHKSIVWLYSAAFQAFFMNKVGLPSENHVRPSVTWCQRLDQFSYFREIRHRSSLRKFVSAGRVWYKCAW